MDPEHRKLLQENALFLIKHLTVDDAFMKASSSVFSPGMIQDIEAEATAIGKANRYINTLQKRGPTAFDKFTDALKATSQTKVLQVLGLASGDDVDKERQCSCPKNNSEDKLENAGESPSRNLVKYPDKLKGYRFWREKLQSARYVVAPMVEQSELPWRLLSRQHGAELTFTPMLHASVFTRDDNYRREWLTTAPQDRPLIVQFCANDPVTLLEAALLAAPHCDAVDLNLGCPQSIAKRGHYGAFLQDEWPLIQKIVRLCDEELPVPITCKTRVFDDVDKSVRYAQMLQAAGCQLLTVHGRTREQKGPMTGLASWRHIKAVRAGTTVPLYANGNIQDLEDVRRCMAETGVDGVMSAEGNLHNPALFLGARPRVWEMGQEYLALVRAHPCPLSCVRAHLFKLYHHALVVHSDVREELAKAKDLSTMETLTAALKQRCQEDEEKGERYEGSFPTPLLFPHWLCQPYVRPPPVDTRQRQQEAGEKRTLEAGGSPPPGELSKKKMKRLQRRNLTSAPPPAEKKVFEVCTAECYNPRGLKCDWGRCKTCCKRLSRRNLTTCTAHWKPTEWRLSKARRKNKEEEEKAAKDAASKVDIDKSADTATDTGEKAADPVSDTGDKADDTATCGEDHQTAEVAVTGESCAGAS